MTNPLPKNLALAQLRLRSITAGLPADLQSLGVESLKFISDDGLHDRHDWNITLRRWSGIGREPRDITVNLRDLVALARMESDHPARAPIADPPTRLSAPPATEQRRIVGMLSAVRDVMADGQWRTLDQIQAEMDKAGHHHGQPAISARIRDLRKAEFGGYPVERQQVTGVRGLFQYRLLPKVQQ